MVYFLMTIAGKYTIHKTQQDAMGWFFLSLAGMVLVISYMFGISTKFIGAMRCHPSLKWYC